MVNHRYKRAVLGITTALVVSACTVPAMAAPITINTDQSISVVSTDNTYAGGLDLEARIITTVEQDQRSPYAKKGIAVADDYLKIHTEPNGDAEVVGKLYSGSGCEIEEVKDGWAHITSGDCDGYVEAKYLLTGTDAEAYADAVLKFYHMDDADRRTMGANARRAAEDYDFKRLTDKLIAVIESITEK